jgi:hypothetical protein
LVNKLATSARQLISVSVRRVGDPPPALPSPESIKNIEWTWKIIRPPPVMNFVELTQESFFDMVLSVADV